MHLFDILADAMTIYRLTETATGMYATIKPFADFLAWPFIAEAIAARFNISSEDVSHASAGGSEFAVVGGWSVIKIERE